jgi:hypothetical protein
LDFKKIGGDHPHDFFLENLSIYVFFNINWSIHPWKNTEESPLCCAKRKHKVIKGQSDNTI